MTYKAHKAWGIYFVGNKNKNGPDWALGYWILAPKWTAQDVTFKGQWHISASLYLMRLYTVVSPWHFWLYAQKKKKKKHINLNSEVKNVGCIWNHILFWVSTYFE